MKITKYDFKTLLQKMRQGFFKTQYKKHSVFIFLSVMIILGLIFYALFLPSLFFQNRFHTVYINLNAKISGLLISVFTKNISVSGSNISMPGYSISLIKGCEAIEPTAFFIFAILAFPASLKKKIFGLISGFIILFILNLVRIISLFYLGYYYPGIVNEVHVYLWPAIYIVITIFIWLVWMRWTLVPDKKN
jgi:exosortase H (IPTLxxWG-CTERM-specific)